MIEKMNTLKNNSKGYMKYNNSIFIGGIRYFEDVSQNNHNEIFLSAIVIIRENAIVMNPSIETENPIKVGLMLFNIE